MHAPIADRSAPAAPGAAAPGPEAVDVLVIGGGPGGSTAAALLARQGRRVVLCEREQHPRFHIGESLLPANAALLDALDLRVEVERIGQRKWGIEFVSPHHAHSSFVEFGWAWDRHLQYAWQVPRAEFDALLFRHAARCGAQALERCEVQEVRFHDRGAEVQAWQADGGLRRFDARMVIDASGRDTFLASRLGQKVRNPRHNSAALFVHVRGAQRLPGQREGNVSIFWFEHGWFWMIPLPDGVTSVGAVCWPHYLKRRAGQPLRAFWDQTVALAPKLAERLRDATVIDDIVHATGNYSYGSRSSHGPHHLLVGDAFAFIDPVFSSGVYLAMASAFEAARTTAVCLDDPARSAAARRRYDAFVRRGPRVFAWLIYRVTNPTMRNLFMSPRNILRMQDAMVSLLAGKTDGSLAQRAALSGFRWVYRIASLARLPRTLAARRRRAINIRDVGLIDGETEVAQRG